MIRSDRPGCLALASLALTAAVAAARADDAALGPAATAPWPTGGLSFDLSGAVGRHASGPEAGSQPADDQPAKPGEPPTTPRQVEEKFALREAFGRAGTTWLSIGGGFAWDFGRNSDVMGNVGWSIFLADALEFRLEAALWYFNQEGNNTGAVSGEMLLHYHFLHDQDWSWTLFCEAGIGLLGAFDEVPDGGTGLVFAPRLGLGFTQRITDDGTRLEVGARWRH